MSDPPVCYICLSEDVNLIRPCVNTKCSARVCINCIKQQYTSDKKCGVCREQILVKNGSFNATQCCESYIKSIYTIIVNFIGSISIMLLALGNTAVRAISPPGVIQFVHGISAHIIIGKSAYHVMILQ